ncbi:LemA family protein [Comamonas aquatica]|jgi:LemA protein|uniref:LemA family protein n=1 Tax=Comamonas aquatica TaxID=225991 RepID=UPI0022DDA051|nr:LemA family protein [Comamonas aquatica]MDH1903343.1 LemA family protein [Comamonas aquatica]WBM41313.1 LemA family protein [Comamonas aquatica]
MTTLWVLLAIVAVLALWGIAVYNRLRQLRNRVDNAWSQIDVQLKRRYDLIPNLVEVARGYLQHEASTLEAVARARSQAVAASDAVRDRARDGQALAALSTAEQVLGGNLGRLMAVMEAYPALKADAQMQRLAEEIASTENRIGFARQAYNDQVMAFNDRASQFPDLLWARLLGFMHLDMLQSTANAQERATPQVRF